MQVLQSAATRQKETVPPPKPLSPVTEVEMAVSYETVRRLASSNAVVVFSVSHCCMSTVAKRLLFSLGVGPTVVELDERADGPAIRAVLRQLVGAHQPAIPAVFIGGKFLGGVESLMASHINGALVPLLKEAGALWL